MAQLACSRQARFQLKFKLQVGPECGNSAVRIKTALCYEAQAPALSLAELSITQNGKQPWMEDYLECKTTLDRGRHWMEDDLGWKKILDGKDLGWKRTLDGRQPRMEDDLG